MMKVRQDAWTDENDLLLAETVLRHVREGSTQLNAFEEVGDKLNRTSAACGFRWNAVVRHRYEKALQLAKKQRKQRQRILGKDDGWKKKLLYTPPVPVIEEMDVTDVPAYQPSEPFEYNHPVAQTTTQVDYEHSYVDMVEDSEFATLMELRTPAPTPTPSYQPATRLTLDTVISFLQNLDSSNLQNEALKSENERLKRENSDFRRQNEQMHARIQDLEQDTVTVQEDYETLMKIMNRARKLVLFEEEERPATKFKMDRNGNLEKVAE